MTIVKTRPVTGGVDTHLDVHVAAALDANGGMLGVESFPTTIVGFAELHAWLSSFGMLCRLGWRAPAPMALGWPGRCGLRGGGGRGRSPEPAGPSPARQVRHCRCRGGRSSGAVGPRCGPPTTSSPRRRCSVAVTPRPRHSRQPGSACAHSLGAGSTSTTRWSPSMPSSTSSPRESRRHCERSRCRPTGRHCRARRSRRQSRAAAFLGVVRRTVRGVTNRCLVRTPTASPAQPLRRPPRQLGAARDHHQPPPLAPRDPGLHGPTPRSGKDPQDGHALPQTTRRPRGLPRHHHRPRPPTQT
jgi:hypothetical protein